MKKEELFEVMNDMNDDMISKAKVYKKKGIRRYIKPIFAVAASACLVMSLPTATALGYDTPYNILYTLSPRIAQTFKPVEESCKDKGIKMEVISSTVEGSKSSFLISLQGDKIDETADLFDSYYINCPFDSTCNVSFSEFDESTKTAYFLINIETMHGEPIKKDKITFGIKELLLNKHEYSGEISDIDLKNVPKNPATKVLSTKSADSLYRGGSGYMLDKSITEYTILADKEDLFSPTKGATITAVGYVGNALHIQTHYEDIGHTDNHGSISLVDENGNIYDDKKTTVVSFWDSSYKNHDEQLSNRHGSYDETIIEIPYDELENYNLYGKFITSDGYVSGDWQVTFRAE